MMNRGEMVEKVGVLCEDTSHSTYPVSRVRESLNDMAESLTNYLAALPHAPWMRRVEAMIGNGVTTAFPIGNVRFTRLIYAFRRNDQANVVIINEHEKHSLTYSAGIDLDGKIPVYLSFLADTRLSFIVALTGATGGTFTFTMLGGTTAAIAWNASAANVATAITSNIPAAVGNVSVTGSIGGPWTVSVVGSLLHTVNTNAIGLVNNSLTGIAPAAAFAVTRLYSEFLNFTQAPPAGETWDVTYSVSPAALADNIADDAKRFDTLPGHADILVAYRSALSLLGIHIDSQDRIAADYQDLMGTFKRNMAQARSKGHVEQVLWGSARTRTARGYNIPR